MQIIERADKWQAQLKIPTDWKTEHYTDISLLLSSCSNVESAEIPTQLREIAAIVAEEDSDFFTSTTPSIALNWILKESEAASKFKAFLEAHGHRSIREVGFQVFIARRVGF
jgi:hypothetical protein